MRFFFIIVFFLFSFSIYSVGQAGIGYSVVPSVLAGSIVRHTPKFLPKPTGFVRAIEVGYQQQTYGLRAWQYERKYPLVGVVGAWYHFGDSAHFGWAAGVSPFIEFRYPIYKNWRGNFGMGMGLAYLNRPFDPIKNPENTAIGTHWNTFIPLKLGVCYALSEHITLVGQLSATHFSNGGIVKPNLGINTVGGQLGVQITPHPVRSYMQPDSLYTKDTDWHVSTHAFVTTNQLAQGPFYASYGISAGVVRYLTFNNRAVVGVEGEYDGSLRTSAFDHGGAQEATPFGEYSRGMVFLGDELLFGKASCLFQLGYYWHKPSTQSTAIYTRIMMRYYLTPHIHIGIQVKTHLATAQYIAFGLGYYW